MFTQEAKPSCLKCKLLGLQCDGYVQPQPLSIDISSDPTERRSFFYFRDETRPHLASFSEYGLWEQLALQRSYSEEAIKLAVVAIGSFHESLETSDITLRKHRQFVASKLYYRALAKAALELPQMPLGDVLLASILLAFLENIRGNALNTIKHLSGAQSILSHHRTTNASQGRSVVVNTVLAPIIDRLGNVLHTLYVPSTAILLNAATDDPIHSFLEAHDQFYGIAESISIHIGTDGKADVPETTLFAWLDLWWARFSDFLTRSKGVTCNCEWPDCHSHHALGFHFLEVLYYTTKPRLHCALANSEAILDLYEDDFPRVLDACEKMTQILKSSDTIMMSARSCLGFKPVHFLGCWMMAEGCRDPVLRRRAISILRGWHHTDGQWDTFLVADVAECLVHREESCSPIQPVTCSMDVPEEARVRFLTTAFFKEDPKTKTLSLVYDLNLSDFLKVSVLRKNPDPFGGKPSVSIEGLWLDRRNKATVLGRIEGMPKAIGGMFPQVQGERPTKLWSMLEDTQSAEDILNARRIKIAHPPFDRVQDPAERSVRSAPLEERVMGLSFRTVMHDD